MHFVCVPHVSCVLQPSCWHACLTPHVPGPCCTQVVIPLLQVLEQLHSMHIVHRDIKPENLLFDAAGALLVGDFGLAVNQLAERPCLRMGTLDYMCPEVSAAGSGTALTGLHTQA